MTNKEKVLNILNTVQYAVVATVDKDGQPWNTPVAHEVDEENNIYWFSDKEGQHSKNVRGNNKVFIVIFDSTAPEGAGEGVYILAKAEEVTDVDLINNIRNKKKQKIVNDAGEFLGESVRRCYKAVPEKFWINSDETVEGKFIRDIRIEVDLQNVEI